MKTSKVIRLSLLIFSIFAFISAVWRFYLWDDLIHPKQRNSPELAVEFTEGKKYEYSFTTYHDARYEIAIEFERSYPTMAESDSLVGYIFSNNLKKGNISLPLSVTLFYSEKQIIKVDSVTEQSFYFRQNKIGRIIDRFDAGKGNQYTISVNIKKTIAALNYRHPKIIVKLTGGAIKQELVNSLIAASMHWYFFCISSGVFVILSIINITWFVILRIPKRKKQQTQ